MGIEIDLIGQKFGRLTVESKNQIRSLSGKIRWNCVCNCGNLATVVGNNLKNGDTTSCGCYNKERITETHFIHGMTGTPEYNSWYSMIRRCTDPNHESYNDYGGRGITVCARWLNSFEAFYEDMGPRSSLNHSLDRKENDKGYYKDNCRWATNLEQNNNLRNNVFYNYRENRYTILQLAMLPEAIKNNVCIDTLTSRIYRSKWSVEDALNIPVRVKSIPTYTYNNVTKTITEWSIEHNVGYHKLYNRLFGMKWDFERAINTP
jgi:hypothetical protein